MRTFLIPASVYTDPTYLRVLGSLFYEFKKSGVSPLIISEPPRNDTGRELLPSRNLATAFINISGESARNAKEEFLSLCLRERPDVINFHFAGISSPWIPVLLSVRKVLKFKLVVTFQDYNHPDLPKNGRRAKVLIADMIAQAHAVTVLSSSLKNSILADFPSARKKISVIPNGVSIQKNIGTGKSRTKPYILCAGRLAHYKGIDLLLMAYAEAVSCGLRSKLIICGADFLDGAMQDFALKLGLKDMVDFVGLRTQNDMRAYFLGCEYFVMLSRFESFGMAALEAMAYGKTVLSSGAGGMKDFIDKTNGLIVNPVDTAHTADAMLQLSSDKMLRKKLGGGARKTAASYDWKKIAREYRLVFQS